MKKIIPVGIVLILIFIITIPALAQNYSFSVEEETVHVWWRSDGTMSLAYEFVFTNHNGASPIDYVDVGIPFPDFSPTKASAEINGIPIQKSHIAHSTEVDGAIELWLDNYSIKSGEKGIVTFRIDGIQNVLYWDSKDDAYASANFWPTWFNSSSVSGSTTLTVIFHLPLGVTSEEPRWHQSPSGWQEGPYTGIDGDGLITYTWFNQNANASKQYQFGASFPAKYVPDDSISKPTFWENLGLDPEAVLGFGIVCGVFGFILIIPILAVVGQRKRKMKYLPPRIAIAGHGIKRGLTAIEAAILLEQPMDKIMTMMLFAVIKKGAAKVTKRKPLTLDIGEPLLPELKVYEKNFLKAMGSQGKALRRKDLQQMMIKLVKSVSKSMKGFSRRETRNYYKDIIKRAWAQVQAADTPEVRGEKYDKVMEWTMLDEDYDDKTRRVFQHYPVFIPHWWHSYSPAPRSSGKVSAPTFKPTPGGTKMPQLPGADFAASVVSGVQNFSADVVGNINDFTSGVTQKTNPIPKTSSGSYRSSGGSSCACACACAGCACACAGGGR